MATWSFRAFVTGWSRSYGWLGALVPGVLICGCWSVWSVRAKSRLKLACLLPEGKKKAAAGGDDAETGFVRQVVNLHDKYLEVQRRLRLKHVELCVLQQHDRCTLECSLADVKQSRHDAMPIHILHHRGVR